MSETPVPHIAERSFSSFSRCRRPSYSQLVSIGKGRDDSRRDAGATRSPVRGMDQCSFLTWQVVLLLTAVAVALLMVWSGFGGSSRYLLRRDQGHVATSSYSFKGPWVLGLVTDLDRESAYGLSGPERKLTERHMSNATRWVSIYKRGQLTLGSDKRGSVTWIDESVLVGMDSRHGRGMELSDLLWFGGKLLSPDDHTGILYEVASPLGRLKAKYASGLLEVMSDTAAPHVRKVADLRFSIHDGDRERFKAEWMVVKDGKLVIGGHGRERTKPSDGRAVVSRKPMWVASVDSKKWGVYATNWTLRYDALRQAAGTPFPGYLLHEAVLWSALRREWIFLPRRVSAEAYDGQDAERKGSRCLFVASENFSTIRRLEVAGLPEAGGLRGFSASAFVPGTNEQWIVALRTVEMEGYGSEKQTKNRTTSTFLSVFDLEDLDATTLVYPENEISKMKFEGIAFV